MDKLDRVIKGLTAKIYSLQNVIRQRKFRGKADKLEETLIHTVSCNQMTHRVYLDLREIKRDPTSYPAMIRGHCPAMT